MEHPEIAWIERTGYPSWVQEREAEVFDEDRVYEEERERELFRPVVRGDADWHT